MITQWKNDWIVELLKMPKVDCLKFLAHLA